MGERPAVYLSDAAKAKTDAVVVGSTALGYFDKIPWTDVAAILACVYTALRIAELIHGWITRK